MLKLVECPRDAMQGFSHFIPTQTKIDYIQQLLAVGFDTLDVGSFVSPKAIPQMADTAVVLEGIDLSATQTRMLAIVPNLKGAVEASKYFQVHYLGFPFSISETFQKRNTNQSLQEAFDNVKAIQDLANRHLKEFVVYFSMGFGNPYGDPWNVELVEEWAVKMSDIGITTIALSDTIGIANQQSISHLFTNLIPRYPEIEFGAHLHTTPDSWQEKIEAAYNAGCRRFDGAIKGFGGCPMAEDKLTGNMPTENMVTYFENKGIQTNINRDAFEKAQLMATKIFV
jgi:hydroxymethylglutaryl-CoA lyase